MWGAFTAVAGEQMFSDESLDYLGKDEDCFEDVIRWTEVGTSLMGLNWKDHV